MCVFSNHLMMKENYPVLFLNYSEDKISQLSEKESEKGKDSKKSLKVKIINPNLYKKYKVHVV